MLYLENDYICALTLAGAAEEIFGSLILAGNNRALDEAKKLYMKELELSQKEAANKLNLCKNGYKHLCEELCEKDIDIEAEARLMIMRAIYNYNQHTQIPTKSMLLFLDHMDSLKEV